VRTTTSRADVLIAGAGPVGLTMAIELARRGLDCRVVDRRPEPRPGSRGCTVYQRTQEVLGTMGLPVDDYLASGAELHRRVYHLSGDEIGHVDTAELGSPRPYPLLVSQEITEQYLAGQLAELGVKVARGIEATLAAQDRECATVRLRGRDGRDAAMRVGWVVGADGSASGIREALGIGWQQRRSFPGLELLQVDAHIRLPGELAEGEGHMFFGDHGHVGILPLADGRHRVFLVHPDPDPANDADPSLGEISAAARELCLVQDLDMSGPRFAWRVRLHGRVAAAFRAGRCFLAGDAARVFPPVYAQGMNTGIQDAFNLGWKLAAVIHGRASPALLDTYEAERLPVALELLQRTGRSLEHATGPAPARGPLLESIMTQRTKRTELTLSYPGGPLTQDMLDDPAPRAGERAPDAPVHGDEPTTLYRMWRGETRWTMLLLSGQDGVRDRALEQFLAIGARYRHSLCTLPVAAGDQGRRGWHDPARELHRTYQAVRQPRVYLVRPDGYVGFRGSFADSAALAAYLRRFLSD
jgi:2-polyprenyl-6-methoxyphenol hydroxylase-like FAD-dependent oxidoreductase